MPAYWCSISAQSTIYWASPGPLYGCNFPPSISTSSVHGICPTILATHHLLFYYYVKLGILQSLISRFRIMTLPWRFSIQMGHQEKSPFVLSLRYTATYLNIVFACCHIHEWQLLWVLLEAWATILMKEFILRPIHYMLRQIMHCEKEKKKKKKGSFVGNSNSRLRQQKRIRCSCLGTPILGSESRQSSKGAGP